MPKPPRTDWYVDEATRAHWPEGDFFTATVRTPTDEPVAEAVAATAQGARRRAHVILRALREAEESRGVRKGNRRR